MQEQELEGLKRACLYSIPPNALGHCGPNGSFPEFQKFLSDPSGGNAIQTKQLLSRFSALYLYLELIGRENGRQPFDLPVVEAYWLGNKLLENVGCRAMQRAILSLQLHGLPRTIAEKKSAELPEGLVSHHSMHVLYVNFLNPKVKPLVENLSNCLVQWASVKEVTGKGIKVKGIELLAESGELKLKEKEKIVQNPFSLKLQPRNLITVHWGNAIEKISPDDLKDLKAYTLKNLETINDSTDAQKE